MKHTEFLAKLVKTAEEKGNLKEILDMLVSYADEIEKKDPETALKITAILEGLNEY